MEQEEKSSDHEHIYGQWFPYDKGRLWKQCVLPGCFAFVVKKA